MFALGRSIAQASGWQSEAVSTSCLQIELGHSPTVQHVVHFCLNDCCFVITSNPPQGLDPRACKSSWALRAWSFTSYTNYNIGGAHRTRFFEMSDPKRYANLCQKIDMVRARATVITPPSDSHDFATLRTRCVSRCHREINFLNYSIVFLINRMRK